ncbi:AAEL000280-PA [Aedes aegypti]|uniref:AAEL000280-PA n=1 Tax=Aedes aegypti TaxID=7159 RepID=Q17PN2_AEDAE|nr:AAEL000280-PA [Aedes aegypti]
MFCKLANFGLIILILFVADQYNAWPLLSGSPELSHFNGAIARTDITCARRVIGKGTVLPVNVYFSTPLTITAYSAEAVEYSKHGFTLGIGNGGLKKTSITLNVGGPTILPYAVEINFYCAAPPVV